jgi:hypothetical protein
MPLNRRRKRRRRRVRLKLLQRSHVRLAAVMLALVTLNLYIFLWRGGTSLPDLMQRAAVAGPNRALPEETPVHPLLPTKDLLKDPGHWRYGEVEAGDSLGAILAREGVDSQNADAVIRALGARMDLQKIRPGQRYGLWWQATRVRSFWFQVSSSERIVLTRERGGLVSQIISVR